MNRESAAVHEAGHGVVAITLGLDVHTIGLLSDGGVAYVAEDGGPRERAATALAGALAEARFLGIPGAWTTARVDLDRARKLAVQSASEEHEADWLALRAREAERLLDEHWAAVEEVARELEGRPMGGWRLYQIVKKLQPEPKSTGEYGVTPSWLGRYRPGDPWSGTVFMRPLRVS